MKEVNKKLVTFALVVVMTLLSLSRPVYATQKDATSNTYIEIGDVTKFLDNSPTTQVVVSSESALLRKMINSRTITRKEINKELYGLSNETEETLQKRGYDHEQIDIIKEYNGDLDAMLYATDSSGAYVTFRYGLAGSNTKKNMLIAYDITWSKIPLISLTDSFGIGFIAADSNNNEQMTETLSAMGQVQYYSTPSGTYKGTGNVAIDTFTNGLVTGTFPMTYGNDGYAKHISGIVNIQSQSETYTMQSLQIFVAYAHTSFRVTVNPKFTLVGKKLTGSVVFTPQQFQSLLVSDHHKFWYYSQDVIVAE